eukprot:1073223-Alexandrium_andersonii.AAC.1
MGVSKVCRFKALERTVRALGEALTAAFSSWASAADSISAQGLFRDVVGLTVGTCGLRQPFSGLGVQRCAGP